MSRTSERLRLSAFILVAALLAGGDTFAQTAPLRPPAVPLVTLDPYFSIWSFADSLHSDWTRHWTGSTNGMSSIVRIDGKPYRLMGRTPESVPPFTQTSVSVTPTRTTYTFSGAGVEVRLSFLTPMLIQDLEWLTRPVAFLTWDVSSVDGADHEVAAYFDVAGEAAVNTPDQGVVWGRFALDSLDVLRIGSQDQRVLGKAGDDLRIDWGHLYIAAAREPGSMFVAAAHDAARSTFAVHGTLPLSDDLESPRPASTDWPVLAHAYTFGTVGAARRSHRFVLAFDDGYSIQYFQRNLRPFWRRNGADAAGLLREASRSAAALDGRCRVFDEDFARDAAAAGGREYASLAVLSYRQCLAANKVVADLDGTALMFPKENFSNGCIGTVDVIYPASPLFLLLNPALLKAQLVPLMDYARLPRWKFPFAPHDLGTYPFANGQVYGGGEKSEENQMPVEESGNMILMIAGIAEVEGNASFAARYWPVVQRWAEYLREKGLDPENQLCTDDFAGHLARNVNLSAKAILALGAYAKLCDMSGKKKDASAYRKLAEQYAREWQAKADDGDHYRLAFDRPGTWSQKYNLVWDELLGLDLFPPEVRRREIRYYLGKQNTYGLPLDSRKSYTKLDWIIWTATMAERQEDFQSLVAPVFRFANQTPTRVPLSDWYETTDGTQVGFQARSVVGGVLIKMLADRRIADTWRSRANGQ